MARTKIDYGDRMPLYRQLAEIIRGRIESGEIPPRRAVPSRRTLMQTFDVSSRTVNDAMKLLKDEGLIETEPGKGFYVRD